VIARVGRSWFEDDVMMIDLFVEELYRIPLQHGRVEELLTFQSRANESSSKELLSAFHSSAQPRPSRETLLSELSSRKS